jgi:hypothetical protein
VRDLRELLTEARDIVWENRLDRMSNQALLVRIDVALAEKAPEPVAVGIVRDGAHGKYLDPIRVNLETVPAGTTLYAAATPVAVQIQACRGPDRDMLASPEGCEMIQAAVQAMQEPLQCIYCLQVGIDDNHRCAGVQSR